MSARTCSFCDRREDQVSDLLEGANGAAICVACLVRLSASYFSNPKSRSHVRSVEIDGESSDVLVYTNEENLALPPELDLAKYLEAVHALTLPTSPGTGDLALRARLRSGDAQARSALIGSYLELAAIIAIKRTPRAVIRGAIANANLAVVDVIDTYESGTLVDQVIRHILSSR